MKRTILFISFEPIQHRRRVLNQINTARELGINVTAISTTPKKLVRSKFTFTYQCIPTPEWIRPGILRFGWFNLLLFVNLLFRRYTVIHFRGLIPMPALFLCQWFNKSLLIYDAHEYYRGHEIFHHRPLRKALWMWFENQLTRHLQYLITVSEPLAEFFKKDYPWTKHIIVIRSLPSKQETMIQVTDASEVDFPQKLVVFHGYFMPGRALEKIISAMSLVEDREIRLMLIGNGPLQGILRSRVETLQLQNRIQFHDILPVEQLLTFIRRATLGLAILEPISLNHQNALPNKFFEYIHAGLPVLASNIPTLQQYIDRYAVGRTVDPGDAPAIARALTEMVNDHAKLEIWRNNCRLAADELNWEKESEKLKNIYQTVYSLPVKRE